MKRQVIIIRAQDSPNVKAGRMIFPGVLTKEEYETRRTNWDEVRQQIGLDAEFPDGGQVMLYPKAWLRRAGLLKHEGMKRKVGKGLGCDPAEGGDKSAWSVVDELGLLFRLSMKTPDTTQVTSTTLALMREWQIPPERVCFDRGGGGKEHADRLRLQGYQVRTVGFGEAIVLDLKRAKTQFKERVENREERYACKKRRDQMYWDLRQLLEKGIFALPFELDQDGELHRQLGAIELQYDEDGRLDLDMKDEESTLMQEIGHSPDEADSLVLAIHAMLYRPVKAVAGMIS